MNALHALRTCSVAALLALGPGCSSTSPEVTPREPTFTAASLREGGLVLLGVVQVDEIPQLRPPLNDAMERTLAAVRPDLRLVKAKDAEAVMGDSTSRFLLLGYQMHGLPEMAWFQRAADALSDSARYGILARVEKDQLEYDVAPRAPRAGETAIPSRVTGRRVRVSVQVYDLRRRMQVYRGLFDSRADGAALPDSLSHRVAPAPAPGVSVEIHQPGQEPPVPPGPTADTPSLARALEPAFQEFTRSLP